jgi:hypothetical protein
MPTRSLFRAYKSLDNSFINLKNRSDRLNWGVKPITKLAMEYAKLSEQFGGFFAQIPTHSSPNQIKHI